jgi:hypothetical protein
LQIYLIQNLSDSGMVTTTQKIDYETTPQLNLTVIAYDSGAPQFSAQAHVTVNIVNINDMDPVFNQVIYLL